MSNFPTNTFPANYTINELRDELMRSPNGIMVGLFHNKQMSFINPSQNMEIMRRNMTFISVDISESQELFSILQQNTLMMDPSNNIRYLRIPSILVFNKENMSFMPNEILDIVY